MCLLSFWYDVVLEDILYCRCDCLFILECVFVVKDNRYIYISNY